SRSGCEPHVAESFDGQICAREPPSSNGPSSENATSRPRSDGRMAGATCPSCTDRQGTSASVKVHTLLSLATCLLPLPSCNGLRRPGLVSTIPPLQKKCLPQTVWWCIKHKSALNPRQQHFSKGGADADSSAPHGVHKSC